VNLFDAWRTTIWPTCQRLVQQYVFAPLGGIIDIASGLMLAVPEAVDATKRAIIGQMSTEARCRVHHGINLIVRGWALVQMPLLVLVLVVAFGWDGLLVAISIGSLMPA
jgi:hypothetical protein